MRDLRHQDFDLEPSSVALGAGVFLLSTATLMFEITLTRLFSVAQFYHFAFMIVSLAMLGFGASGTWLVVWPKWGHRCPGRALGFLVCAYGASALGAYFLINVVPFDSFSIAWDPRQVLILFVHYLALSLPFFFSGAVLSLLFSLYPGAIGSLYAVNLLGSALGCVVALLLPSGVGGEGVVWASCTLAGLAALFVTSAIPSRRSSVRTARRVLQFIALALIGGTAVFLVRRPEGALLRLSPYKALSYALQVPEARVLFRKWNGFSRVDLVASPTIRSLPGLSYRYLAPPPPQHGLFVDGDDTSPVLQLPVGALTRSDDERVGFAGYLPTALAYRLRPGGGALILAPRGGLEVWTALSQGAGHAHVVEPNPLVVEAVGSLYEADVVTLVNEEPRSFVRRADRRYEVVTLALTAPYRPIRSGAYSLGEDYRYTVQAFRDYLSCLVPEGVFVVSRWVQTPPSESLRTFALIISALEEAGGDPTTQVVAFRGYAMMTYLVKVRPFSEAELGEIRNFVDERAFDMVFAPELSTGEVNQHNVLPSPVYYEAFRDLIEAEDREAWYAAYPFDVRPPTDDHPFFAHFFKWSQARQVLAELGKTWQPFGGAGYFVLLALLGLSALAALLLIGVPAVVGRWRRNGTQGQRRGLGRDLLYFGFLGIGFLFVEIPLMQRTILFLGHPAYAVTAVLFALLLFSGVGSMLSNRLADKLPIVLMALVLLILFYGAGLSLAYQGFLALPWAARLGLTVLLLGPIGVLMGMPFPLGLRHLSGEAPGRLPWAWAVNGAMSVVASILSALIALSVGFTLVLLSAAVCYAGAWWVARRW
ncbi:MAG: hypothetical protein ACP5HS_08900 [Anaerolineae bacterium]